LDYFQGNSLQSSNSAVADTLKGIFGVALGSVTGNVGVTCSPLSLVGGGSSW